MKRDISLFMSGIVYVAILYVLVRPNSQGPTLIESVTSAFANLIRAATGGATPGIGS